MSSLSPGFIRMIARAVERGHGTMADVDHLVSCWEQRANGNAAGLRGVLRTYEGKPLPRATEDLVLLLRAVFGDRDAMPARTLAAELGVSTQKLAKLLEGAGIVPMNVKVDGGQRKGYRRGWFEGYFEQLDAAYTAPTREAEEAVIEQLKGAFDAIEVDPRYGERDMHVLGRTVLRGPGPGLPRRVKEALAELEDPPQPTRVELAAWWGRAPGCQPDRGAAFIRETNARGARGH